MIDYIDEQVRLYISRDQELSAKPSQTELLDSCDVAFLLPWLVPGKQVGSSPHFASVLLANAETLARLNEAKQTCSSSPDPPALISILRDLRQVRVKVAAPPPASTYNL
jgi:hypothetical protein